jgi:hypothetical protein
MGYTTNFEGEFKLDKPLTVAQIDYLRAFRATRRMKRDASKVGLLSDPKRHAVDLPIGEFGEYFVGNEANYGQDRDESVLDGNSPPPSQPGLWCQWEPNGDGTGICWDGGEKFYYYVEWLEYIVERFLKPWGLTLSGEVEWRGEDPSDLGLISVKGNVITVKIGKVVYE